MLLQMPLVIMVCFCLTWNKNNSLEQAYIVMDSMYDVYRYITNEQLIYNFK